MTAAAAPSVNERLNDVIGPATLLRMINAEDRLRELGLVLPAPPAPMGTYAVAVLHGGTLYTSGNGPLRADGSYVTGCLGKDLTVEEGIAAARLTALAMLATVRAQLGSLDRVARIVKVLGFVRCVPEFTEPPKVINGFSDLMVQVFGDRALGARSAVGTAALPAGIAVEVEAILAVTE